MLVLSKFSHRRNTYKLIKKLEYFHVQYTLFGISNKVKYIKKSLNRKERKVQNRPTKPFPNKWQRKLPYSVKDLYYNQRKWINGHKYRKGQYYNEYYHDDLDLVTIEKTSCSGESEAESHNDSVPHEMFFAKEKHILVCIYL